MHFERRKSEHEAGWNSTYGTQTVAAMFLRKNPTKKKLFGGE